MTLATTTPINSLFPKGIHNGGATCYIASAIQCMSHCESFLKFILTANPSDDMPLTQSLRSVIMDCWIRQKVSDPRNLLQSLKHSLSDILEIHCQNDVMEFITLFVDKINDEAGTRRARKEKDTKHSGLKALINQMDVEWTNTHALCHSKIIPMFFSQNIIQMECQCCQAKEHLSEVLMNLSVSFPDEQQPPMSIHELIRTAYASETIQKRKCDACNVETSGARSLRIWRLPHIMIVHLKRFDARSRKLTRMVDVPDMLDFEDLYMYDETAKYKLKSIACHVGACQGGHYFAACMHPTGRWFMYDDDDEPRELKGFADIKSELYYALFYERIPS